MADLYEAIGDGITAIRCLERVILVDTRSSLPQLKADSERLAELLTRFRP